MGGGGEGDERERYRSDLINFSSKDSSFCSLELKSFQFPIRSL